MKKSPQIPLVSALAWIVGSAFLVSGVGNVLIKHLLKEKKLYAQKQAPVIQTLIQTGPQREALKTEYLAQLLNLSADRPPLATAFDTKKAEETLRNCPLIAEAHVKLLKPSTLYIDYTIRKPVAWLSDYENIALDKAGYPFPFRPFFSPKNLPEIYIGEPMIQWNHPVQGKQMELALKLLELLDQPQIHELTMLKRIDVSNAFAESYGTREIVVVVEDLITIQYGEREIQYLFPKILRLSTKHYAAELGNFLTLRKQLVENERSRIQPAPSHCGIVRQKETVIDFRIPNLAFVNNP